MKQRLLIVDGHSLIFRNPTLAASHARNGAAAREAVVQMLTEFQDSTTWEVAVVFDGKGSRAQDVTTPGGIFIFYSASGQTADSVIERLVAKYAQTLDVTVATDDHMERTTVSSLGASAMSIIQLQEEMDAAGRDLRDTLRKLRNR